MPAIWYTFGFTGSTKMQKLKTAFQQELIEFAEKILNIDAHQGEKLTKPVLDEIDRVSDEMVDIAVESTSHLAA